MLTRREALAALGVLAAGSRNPVSGSVLPSWLEGGKFQWIASPPLVEPAAGREDPCHAIKDPSVVFYDKHWHIFATIRSRKPTHQIEYLSFADWDHTAKANRVVLRLTDGYFCAPQVFWHTTHERWYLLYQVSEPTRKPSLQPAYSTTQSIAKPDSWTKPKLLFDKHPDNVRMWIDFWTISDGERMHLFFTSLDGKMWRTATKIADFPHGWDKPEVVLEGDIFEASHTYKVQEIDKFLTLIEAQGPGGRRYYKAYVADRLDGKWTGLADTLERPFAAPANVRDKARHWTDSFSHGELVRASHDERLEVNPKRLQFLFQGVSDKDRQGKNYGEIPWKLGLLSLVT